MPIPKPDIRFSVKAEPSDGFGSDRYLHLRAYPMTQESRGDALEWTYPSDYGDHQHLASLVASAQLDSRAREPYGFSVEYRRHTVGLAAAEVMVKTLRKVQQGTDRLTHQFGYPTDFAAYLAYVAKALGATTTSCFGRRSQTSWDGYHWMDASSLRSYFLSEIAKWREKHGIVVPEAA